MKRLATALAVMVLGSLVVAPAQAANLQSAPKIGSCYLFSEKELNASSPMTNPIPCFKVHNAETFAIGTWSLKSEPSRYDNDTVVAAVRKICLNFWAYPDNSDLNYLAFFTPTASQWAKGARWVRCDAMAMVAEKGTFKQKYSTWSGNAGLNSGYLA